MGIPWLPVSILYKFRFPLLDLRSYKSTPYQHHITFNITNSARIHNGHSHHDQSVREPNCSPPWLPVALCRGSPELVSNPTPTLHSYPARPLGIFKFLANNSINSNRSMISSPDSDWSESSNWCTVSVCVQRTNTSSVPVFAYFLI